MIDIANQVDKTIITGINKFAKEYNLPPEDVQIVFKLTADGELDFFTFVKETIWQKVQLQHLIGKNFYNFAVKKHIKELLLKFARQQGLKPNEINLMTGVKQKAVFIWLRQETTFIRAITDPDELKKTM